MEQNGRRTATMAEAAKLLGIGRNQAYEAARRGEFPPSGSASACSFSWPRLSACSRALRNGGVRHGYFAGDTDMSKRYQPLSPAQAQLQERAKEKMDLWFPTLSYKDRGKLKMDRSPWGRHGGSIIALGTRQGKTARKNKKSKREREARFKAEKAAYEARLDLPAPIEPDRSS